MTTDRVQHALELARDQFDNDGIFMAPAAALAAIEAAHLALTDPDYHTQLLQHALNAFADSVLGPPSQPGMGSKQP